MQAAPCKSHQGGPLGFNCLHACHPTSLQDTVREMKKKFHATKQAMYPARQRFTLLPKAGDERGQVLEDGNTLASYGLKDGSTVLFKDLGPQVLLARCRVLD